MNRYNSELRKRSSHLLDHTYSVFLADFDVMILDADPKSSELLRAHDVVCYIDKIW